MALSAPQQFRYWSIGAVATLFVLWLLSGVLLPFVTGMAIAYFLDPSADKLEKLGFSRVVATSIITFIGLFAGFLMIALLVPQLVTQLAALVAAAPDYFAQAQDVLVSRFPSLLDETSTIRGALDGFVASIQERSGDLANAVLASAFSVVDAVVFIVIAPVVAFYMLLDWDRMVATIDSWLPRDHRHTLRELARELDSVMSGFVRGQLTVCAILGTFYAVH